MAKLMKQVRSDLTRQVGGHPAAAQAMLIERAATLAGYLARLDTEALSPEGMSDHRRREYLAADGSLRRTLAQIGMDAVPPPVKTLAQHLAERAATKAAAQ